MGFLVGSAYRCVRSFGLVFQVSFMLFFSSSAYMKTRSVLVCVIPKYCWRRGWYRQGVHRVSLSSCSRFLVRGARDNAASS